MANRRDLMKLTTGSLLALPLLGRAATASAQSAAQTAATAACAKLAPVWGRGIEGQRIADRGDGTFLNPILSGDYPDPTILKDGQDYYLTHSSFDAAPGLLIWHSRDLVNWRPVGPSLASPLGTVFAPELVKHGSRYFIYLPFMRAPWSTELAATSTIYAIWADSIDGPWSEPVNLGLEGAIDPGHVVGEDGHRYLFLSGGRRARLSADGLSVVGPVETVYEGWRYPDDWITEAYALEGPKLFRRGDYFYLVTAVGGTGGPPTGHMIVVSRAPSIHGPWEHCPHNPIVRTQTQNEMWWSRGHATAVEGPGEQWYMVYHGYENGYRTLGRQTLLEPIEWDEHGWFRAVGGDLSVPLPIPLGRPVAHGFARSDDFASLRTGTVWSRYASAPDNPAGLTVRDGVLELEAFGTGPQDGAVLTQQVGDRSFSISVEVELTGDAVGGLLLFFNSRLFLGMGINGERMLTYRGGKVSHWPEPAPAVRRMWQRITSENHIVTYHYSLDGQHWTRHGVRSEVSGYHANTVDDLLSLRPALFAAGSGTVRFRNFVYRALGADGAG